MQNGTRWKGDGQHSGSYEDHWAHTVEFRNVNSRRAAVAELSASWGKITNVNHIFDKAASIAESLGGAGTPSPSLGEEVQGVLQKHASAFLYSESPLEVGVCAGMAAVSIMKAEPGTSGWRITNVYSNALWSALTFQPSLEDVKRENLRREVLELAQSRSVKSANQARERGVVPDPLDLTVTIDEGNKVTTNFKNSVTNTIETLRRNAALDREELDFLWWAQLDSQPSAEPPAGRYRRADPAGRFGNRGGRSSAAPACRRAL